MLKEMAMSPDQNVECCPRFNPEPWDDKEITWEGKKTYCYYTTCPRCAKKYGKNYVVLLAQT
jgi:hypothetical protein